MRTGKQTVISRPVARQEGLLVETVDGDTVVYDLESKEVHCLKSLAAVVFSQADGTKTASEIAELAAYRLGENVSEADVKEAVSQLQQRGLIDLALAGDGISRRDALRGIAAAGAGAIMITTIAAPTALAAGSTIATGNCCGNSAAGDTCTGLNPTCASGHCCQNNSGKSCNQCKCVGNKNDCQVGASCSTNSNCPAGNECVNGVCCTVIATAGGGVLSC